MPITHASPTDGSIYSTDLQRRKGPRCLGRDADQTLVDKREAMGRYDRTFSTTANLISHMLRAAGEVELATRVRPSTRKPGQTVEDSKEETGSEPAQ